MILFSHLKESVLHLAFPHVCDGCGSDLIELPDRLCLRCRASLPQTQYHLHYANPIEKLFWGRIPLQAATAQYYFTKESLMQQLMHQLKYKGNQDLGRYLGQLMGAALAGSNRFLHVDGLIPLPLFPERERKRGYNQATLLCQGIHAQLQKPVLQDVVVRVSATETQTRKGRVERWQNMEGRFRLIDPAAVSNKHLLLVDDVITTGATLEACGSVLLQASGLQLSLASLCFSAR